MDWNSISMIQIWTKFKKLSGRILKMNTRHSLQTTVPTAIAVVASSFEIAMSRKNESIVRKENNEEVEKILLKIKEHVPEKYCVTFDKVSGFNIERELFFKYFFGSITEFEKIPCQYHR